MLAIPIMVASVMQELLSICCRILPFVGELILFICLSHTAIRKCDGKASFLRHGSCVLNKRAIDARSSCIKRKGKESRSSILFPHALSVSASTSPEFPSLAQRQRAELCLCVHKQGMQIFLVTVAAFFFFLLFFSHLAYFV